MEKNLRVYTQNCDLRLVVTLKVDLCIIFHRFSHKEQVTTLKKEKKFNQNFSIGTFIDKIS